MLDVLPVIGPALARIFSSLSDSPQAGRWKGSESVARYGAAATLVHFGITKGDDCGRRPRLYTL
jgi:hypothetical protein